MAYGYIVLTRGDDYSETHAWDTTAGLDYDLTGCTIRFTVKARPSDADVDAVLQHQSGDGSLTITGAATGAVSHVISAAETDLMAPGVYVYDYQIVAIDGTVGTPERGKLVVRPDVTRSIA